MTYATPPAVRALKRVSRVPGECWLWPGACTRDGYGVVYLRRQQFRVHRVVYEHLVGPIPEGLGIDHLCRNRSCCNPEHLEPVTHAENRFRARSVFCKKGHLMDRIRPDGRRYCRHCANAYKATSEYKAYRARAYAKRKKPTTTTTEVPHG